MRNLAIVVLLIAGAARADDDDATTRAQALYRQGQVAYQLGEFERALTAFTDAYAALPIPAFLFNQGQCYRRLKDHAHAVEVFEKYVALEKDIPAARKKDLKKQLAAEKKLLAADEKRAARNKPKGTAVAAAPPVAPPAAPVAAPPTPPAPPAPPPTTVVDATPAPAPSPVPSAAPPGGFGPHRDVATPPVASAPAAKAPAAKVVAEQPAPESGPLWTNPFVLTAVGVAAVAAAGGVVAFVALAPGPTPPTTSLGTVDLRAP